MALSREHGIIIGVVLLGGLSFLVYRQAKHDEQLGTTSKADLPEVKGTDDLDKIDITNGDKPTITLQKKGDKWMVTAPLEAPASANNVKTLLDNLKELKATEMVASNADDAMKASYNLDAAHAIHLVGYKGADKKVDDWFGKSGGRGEMMMVNGKPDILAASGYSSYLYTRDLKDWRDREILKFDAANLASIEIHNASGDISCTKTGDKYSCTDNGKPIPSFDDNKPAELGRMLQNLQADDFAGTDKTKDNTGLAAKDAARITVTLKDNAGQHVVTVGDVATGTSRYAMKDGDPTTIYTINGTISDWAEAKVDKLQKAADAGAASPAKTASKFPK